VTKRIPQLAVAVFAASANLAWAADLSPSVQRDLYEDGRWSVGAVAFASGNRDCVIANTQRMSSGETAFVLSEFSGNSTIMFRDTTATWNSSNGSVTFQIDDNPSFTGQAYAATGNLLIVPLRGTPSTTMGTIMNQLANGRLLLLGAGAEPPRMFTLDGAQPAFDAFSRCVAALHNH
jgi:hypothetical protein